VVTAEDGVRHGGAGAFIVDAMETSMEWRGRRGPITRTLGVPREYIAQGKADDILDSLGLNGTGIAESVRGALQSVPADQHQS
jgi:deoxyxylulose-5-phosphate synthase